MRNQPVVIALVPLSSTRIDAKGTELFRDLRTHGLLRAPLEEKDCKNSVAHVPGSLRG